MLCCLGLAAETGASRPAVGAIRWDAWHGQRGEPGRVVERSLGPREWHYRLPFFAKVLSPSTVSIDGSSPEVMDREIAYAAKAGIDYWAFVTYNAGDPMSLGLANYLKSRHKRGLRFCLITEQQRWGGPDSYESHARRLAALMREPSYLRVAGGRPLLYLGFISDETTTSRWGGIQGFRKAVDDMRRLARENGAGNPYIAIMEPVAVRAAMLRRQLGADAVSAYAVQSGGKRAPYSKLAAYARRFWDDCASTDSAVIPIAMSGWDRRPRVERPVPWETWQKPGAGLDEYYEGPTPAELARHVEESLNWIDRHPQAAPARTALIYAWNENDEGGWLVPTLGEGTERLDALRRVLRPTR
ncbi:MAG: hypothetical protein ABFD86_17270, partial [Bryobacteraceae bacterium]